jgi:succinate-semialdehyde dehydrogenase/glutarate-semialdehyde dehydrogenase
MMMFGFKVCPALAAGNSVIVKPASEIARNHKLVELMHVAGVPGEAASVITAEGRIWATAFFDDPRLDLVPDRQHRVGRSIAKFGAEYLYPCALELGGNDPLIVCADADLDNAVMQAAAARISNGGQICVSPKRMIVHKSIADEFVNKMADYYKTVEIGFFSEIDRAFDELTGKYGRFPSLGELMAESGNYVKHNYIQPLISEKAAITVEGQIQHTINQGATLACGGRRHGCFIEPTILTNVTRDMDIAKDMEIFGPVAAVITFDTVEEAIDIANQSSCGLSGGVFTADWKTGMRCAREIQSGGVVVNGTGMYRADMQPFGGYKHSGLGREGLITLVR